MVMEKLKGRGKAMSWLFTGTARLDAGAHFAKECCV